MRRVIGVCIICSSACAAMATLTTPSIAGGGSGASSSVDFSVSGPESPVNVLVVMLPSGLKFDSRNQFKIISQTPKNLVQEAEYIADSDNNPSNSSATHNIGAAYSACTAQGAQCLIVEFNSPGLGPNDSVKFSQGILNGKVPATLQQLAGANITFGLNLTAPAGTTTPSQFITTSELEFNGTMDTASTQNASTTMPASVGNPGAFMGSGVPCTPIYDAFGNLTCQSPVNTGITDGDPSQEGGQ